MSVVNNFKAQSMWHHLYEVSEKSGKYQMTLTNLTEEQLAVIKKAVQDVAMEKGVPMADAMKCINKENNDKYLGTPEDRGMFINLKADDKHPPVVVDSQGNPWPKAKLIGNGTTVKVNLKPYKWKGPHGSGIGFNLGTVMIVDLVEFGGASGAETIEAEDGGFVLDKDDVVFADDVTADTFDSDVEFDDDIPFDNA